MTEAFAVSHGMEENGRLSVGLTAKRVERRSVPDSYWDFQPYCHQLKDVLSEK